MSEHDEGKGGASGLPRHTDELRVRLDEIQTRHRGRIRWHLTKHTAELAIRALSEEPDERARRSSKSRRRKRKKRLL